MTWEQKDRIKTLCKKYDIIIYTGAILVFFIGMIGLEATGII